MTTNALKLIEIQNELNTKPRERNDVVKWRCKDTRGFSIKVVWNVIPWKNIVWCKKYIPRDVMVLLKAIKERLHTKDKVIRFSLGNDSTCSFVATQIKLLTVFFSLAKLP